jgi:hypothetical protein
MTNDNDVDDRVLHAGLPVIEEEKWVMNIWIRQSSVPLPAAPPDQATASASGLDARGQ